MHNLKKNENIFLWNESFYSDKLIVNNYTNINNNEQSPLTLTHWTQKNTTTYGTENPGPGLGQAHKMWRG